MTMHVKAFFLACLVYLGHARRMSTQPQKAKVAERSIDTEVEPLKDLATFLSAFNPSGPIVRPSQNAVAQRPVKSMIGRVLEAERSDLPALDARRRGYGPAMVEKREDYWTVCIVGALLAAISGFVNIIAFLELGLPITHHTGTASHYGRLVGLPNVGFGAFTGYVALKLGLFMIAYSAGAAAAGATKVDGEAPFVGKTSIQLLGSAVAIALGAFVRDQSGTLCLMLLSFSQGLMNAVTSCFPAGPIRVTHVSGTLTDIGIGFGKWLKARRFGKELPSLRKPLFLFYQLCAFAFGGYIARYMHGPCGVEAVFAPALVLSILAAGRPKERTIY